jgi:uncharacterized membrane protein HdeD (DUF308 family)
MGVFRGAPHGLVAIGGIALLVAVILVLVAGRRDDDPAQTRTQARYVGAITLVSLFVALFAFFGVARALTDLIVDKDDASSTVAIGGTEIPKELRDILEQQSGTQTGLDLGPGPGIGRSDDADYRAAMKSGLLMIAALAVFVFHERRGRRLVPADRFAEGGTARVARAALYGACFVAAVIALLAAARGVYGVFRVIAPGITGHGSDDAERQRGIAELISFGLLTGASVFIFLRAWYWLPEHREP